VQNRSHDNLRVLLEHPPGKAQHPPAIHDQSVLPRSVRFEEILILFVKPAINLNREFEVRNAMSR
jgi:hypothetical protein